MFWKLSESIAYFMLPDSEEEDREVYCYGVWILFTTVLDTLEILLLGLVLGKVPEAIIYLAILMFLRTYTGGYHASTFVKCNVISIGCYLLNLVLSQRLLLVQSGIMAGMILLFTVLLVCYAAPVEHINKPLTAKEKKRYRIYSILLTLGISALTLLVYDRYEKQTSFTVITMGMVGFMMLLELILQRKGRNRNEEKW